MEKKRQLGESVVLIHEDYHKLRYSGLIKCISVRSHSFPADDGNLEYEEGRDYRINHLEGTISRTPDSRIPNWANHVLYEKADFDHNLYKDCSNRAYTIWVDYEYDQEVNPPLDGLEAPAQRRKLQRVIDKLVGGRSIRYVVFGDSISAGGDASRDEVAFYQLFADELRKSSKHADIEVINKAIGGESSVGGLSRVEADVISLQPDLVSIGYGMNDHCRMGEEIWNGIPPGLFERNIRQIVTKIQEQTDAEIILVTPCISNPLWTHSSGDMAIYADILLRLGRECGVCTADVHELWLQELYAGKTHESLLLNNINHPNDYGHQIYAQAFRHLI
ncbi:SGNH/GDSL hydrolase family protein [Paenibacillus eucommiae]|uniref:Lysophospholipase L1-like esterase n=1 Tax=Paenibacillus eucommiae TaxID=1355755 RepID=A0ABS4J3W8_9BACL|nr:GDSL-type esterase/lipase family protein [Paenibacillus eucommiae]MBP1994534.1 lysophospholipase L1-like esterase [Paenibacillus eucommiae]